jgi:hypothetical protein
MKTRLSQRNLAMLGSLLFFRSFSVYHDKNCRVSQSFLLLRPPSGCVKREETETETETDGEVVRGMKHVDIEIQSTTLASASRNDVQRPPTRQERQLMEVGLN